MGLFDSNSQSVYDDARTAGAEGGITFGKSARYNTLGSSGITFGASSKGNAVSIQQIAPGLIENFETYAETLADVAANASGSVERSATIAAGSLADSAALLSSTLANVGQPGENETTRNAMLAAVALAALVVGAMIYKG